MRILTKALALGVLTAIIGLMTGPLLVDLEAELGLRWLFKLRGPRPPPESVIIVGINSESLRRLNIDARLLDQYMLRDRLPPDSRALHARLLRRLSAAGAQVIVFDIDFSETGDKDHDREFADAIEAAGNVVLFERLGVKNPRRLGATATAPVTILQRQFPISILAQKAAATAPFPLPRSSTQLNKLWLFKPGAGDVPTLPVMALQVYANPYQQAWLDLLATSVAPATKPGGSVAADRRRYPMSVSQQVRYHRQLLQTYPSLRRRLLAHLQTLFISPEKAHLEKVLRALVDLYSGGQIRYLNYYGPPSTLTVIPYDEVIQPSLDSALGSAAMDFNGKAVFVGFVEDFPAHQRDTFYTVFSQPDGLDLSGVEIAATAFSNLLERSFITPAGVGGYLSILILWGLCLGVLCMTLAGVWVIPVLLLSAGAYLVLSHQLFLHYNLWLPLVTPLLLQGAFAVVAGLLWRHLHTQRERQRVRHMFSYYLPDAVVDELTRSGADLPAQRQPVYAVCVDSDAAQYTQFAEKLALERLHTLLNRYYATLFAPVKRYGGFVSDVIGDAMLAIWSAPTPSAELRERACNGAIEIIEAVERFNRASQEINLPTRIGIHCGNILLGNVGAEDHYEYRAVGDTVNTASRVQRLNKQLGTQILVTQPVLEGLQGFVYRPLGAFRLPGKRSPVVICELIGKAGHENAAQQDCCRRFAAGLAAFQSQRWQEAEDIFQALLRRYPDDGPARYYVGLCTYWADEPSQEKWDGVIVL